MTERYLFNNNNVLSGFIPAIRAVTVDTVVYAPTVIVRSSMNLTDNFEKSSITFSFERTHVYAKDLLQNLPEVPVTVIIYKDDVAIWYGEVKDVKASKTKIDLICNSEGSNLTRNVQRARVGLQCYKRLYSLDCGVIKALWGVPYSVTASSSSVVVSGLTQAVGYFNGGIIELNGQSRRIVNQTATNVILTHPFTGIQAGTAMLFPGCALSEAACTAFGNLANGGMFDSLPGKNPFGSSGLL